MPCFQCGYAKESGNGLTWICLHPGPLCGCVLQKMDNKLIEPEAGINGLWRYGSPGWCPLLQEAEEPEAPADQESQ